MAMNLLKLEYLKKFDVFDILLLVLFVVYVTFHISTPQWLVPMIDSPLGMLVLFAVTVSLFVYRNPILGVLFIFVAYELLRRNHYVAPASPVVEDTQYLANRVPQKIPTQSEKNSELNALNPPHSTTLEEEIISKESPIGVSNLPVMMNTSFVPLNDKSALNMSAV
jgi:hypothetical protein